MECVILIGLPGSGKSTFFRERFALTHEHVSKDVMRHNRQPQRRQEQLIDAALASGRSVVVDNTNPRAADRASSIAIARRYGADVAGYFFPTEAADAIRRNRARQGRDRVPAVASRHASDSRFQLTRRGSTVCTQLPSTRPHGRSTFTSHRANLLTQLWLLRFTMRFRRARMRLFVSIVAILLLATAAAPRLQAQTTHAAPQSALDAAVQQHVDTNAADREAVLRVLGHSEVKRVAERAGIDLRRATGAVSTLQGEDLARVAAQAQQVDNALSGGQSRIVISTTLIIIALLVLILIIVAVD